MVSVAPERTEHEARSRRLWLVVRRALLMIIGAIEAEYGVGRRACARETVLD